MNARILPLWVRTTEQLSALTPLTLLLLRVFVALAFWRAGVVKFGDPSGTDYLFSEEYQVPLLSASVAAFLGTWVELIVPWFLALGLATRPMAAFLFVYNLIAVISYPALWPNGFWHGLVGTEFGDHKAWGLMLLVLVALGAGRWSLDALLRRHLERRATRIAPAM
jgi:putative oxidoreductase